jgi:hypothetical protein
VIVAKLIVVSRVDKNADLEVSLGTESLEGMTFYRLILSIEASERPNLSEYV